MKDAYTVKIPVKKTVSTLLIGEWIFTQFDFLRSLNGKDFAVYLHKLLEDPLVYKKLDGFKSFKWKKQYQAEGQDLVRVNFYPEHADWAKLSILSHSTGLSRCYIFVILLLFELGVISLKKNGTQKNFISDNIGTGCHCEVTLSPDKNFLIRTYQNQPLTFTIGFT